MGDYHRHGAKPKFVIDNIQFFVFHFFLPHVLIVIHLLFRICFLVPRKVLLESFDVPMELDEQNQQESDYENELDEDDGHYKEAIPPAPKLQGTIPRSDAANNATQSVATKAGAAVAADDTKSDSMEKSFSEGSNARFLCLF